MGARLINHLFVLIAICMFGSCSSEDNDLGNNGRDGQSDDTVEIVATNLEVPWEIDFLPDGAMIFTERTGAVKLLRNGSQETVGTFEVASESEAGLLGLAVDPDFSSTKRIYMYYTYRSAQGMLNRVSVFTLNSTLEDEQILIDSIEGEVFHDGGRIEFGPDGLVYITTGDAGVPERSQDTSSLNGKILRMNPDGTIPQDNPFGNYVYALGIRNSEGVDWYDDTMYAVDHGPQRHDEVNIIERGENYGWPRTCDDYPAYRCYTDFTLAPADIVATDTFLYVSGLRGNQIRRINRNTGEQQALFTGYGRIRPLTIHEGYLYFGTSNRDGRGNPASDDDKIVRVPLSELR